METIKILTQEDLNIFKQQLLQEFQEILKTTSEPDTPWIKARDARKMLSLSENSLKQLRIQKKLTRVKLGGSFYYSKQEILSLFNERTIQ